MNDVRPGETPEVFEEKRLVPRLYRRYNINMGRE